MQCAVCGFPNPAGQQNCQQCGSKLPDQRPQQGPGPSVPPVARNPFGDYATQNPFSGGVSPPPAPSSDDMGKDPAMRMLLPVGRSPFAIIAGYLGLLSFGICCLGPAAIVFAILAIRDIRRNPENHGMPRAILGLVGGIVGSIGTIIAILSMIFGR